MIERNKTTDALLREWKARNKVVIKPETETPQKPLHKEKGIWTYSRLDGSRSYVARVKIGGVVHRSSHDTIEEAKIAHAEMLSKRQEIYYLNGLVKRHDISYAKKPLPKKTQGKS